MRELADAQESMKKHIDSLENFMKSEASSLLHRLQEEQNERATAIKNEQKERAESIRAEQRERNEALKKDRSETEESAAGLTREFAKLEELIGRKLTAHSNTLDTVEQGLRQLLLSEKASLSEEITAKYKESLNALTRTAAELRADLVSRSALAGLFTETAIRLAGEGVFSPSQENTQSTPEQPGNA